MNEFLMGAIAMGFAVAGVHFLRSWRATRDRLFAFFALSVFIMALNRLAFIFVSPQVGHDDYLYWVRFLAFAVLLVAILDKNRSRKRSLRSS
jgi:hypothetical protein